MPTVATAAPAGPPNRYPTNVARREEWSGRHLSYRDGVQQLLLGEPAETLDNLGTQERKQHVSAAEEQRANPDEDQKQQP